jgi:gas vesicle protein
MNNMSFFKGMGLGVVVGSMVGMAAMPHKKKFSMGKALKSMGDVVENVTNAIGL